VMANTKTKRLDTIALPVQLRLRFIECVVEFYGSINRTLLTEYFGLSMPQVSLDLKLYMDIAPANIVYDGTRRAYVKTDRFRRVMP
jgi:hypothetical protein